MVITQYFPKGIYTHCQWGAGNACQAPLSGLSLSLLPGGLLQPFHVTRKRKRALSMEPASTQLLPPGPPRGVGMETMPPHLKHIGASAWVGKQRWMFINYQAFEKRAGTSPAEAEADLGYFWVTVILVWVGETALIASYGLSPHLELLWHCSCKHKTKLSHWDTLDFGKVIA